MKMKSERGAASSVLLAICLILIIALSAGIVYVVLNQEKIDSGIITGNAESVFDESGNVEGKLHIGDYVAYNEGTGNSYVFENEGTRKERKLETQGNLKWRVLGVKDGKIELICDDGIKLEELTDGIYINEKLDDICAIYGKGVGAESARSISINDFSAYFTIDDEHKNRFNPYELMPINSTEYNVLFRNENGLYKEYMINYPGDTYQMYTFVGYSMGTMDYAIRNMDEQINEVLPIVTLKSDIKFSGVNEDGVWQIDGSEESVKQNNKEEYTDIATKEDLLKLSRGQSSLRSNYRLTADIDLSGETNFSPIDGYVGIFDGNGHKISNLNIVADKAGNYALFGETQDAVIKNVIIENSNISVDAVINEDEKIVIASLVANGENTNVINCSASGIINVVKIDGEYTSGSFAAGMLIGKINEGYIYNSSACGKINADLLRTSGLLGGFAYNLQRCSIENCISNVDIVTNKSCSGFAHYIDNSGVVRCGSNSTLKSTSTDTYNGAFAFAYQINLNTRVAQSYAKFNITSNMASGFIYWPPSAFFYSELADCYSSGELNVYDVNSKVDYIDMIGEKYTPIIRCCESILVKAGDKSTDIKVVYDNDKNATQVKGGYTKDNFKDFNFDYIWKWNEQESCPELYFE